MLVRKPMMLLACGALALGAMACENKDTSKTEPNPAVPEQPVTITNAPATPPAQAMPAPVAPVNPIANATNATEVTQFPDQMKVAPSQAKVTTATATVRPAPQSSDKVQVVKQGLEVTELAKDKDYYLVLFNDSSDSAKQKAGWIHKDSLETYATERADKNSKEPLTGPSAAKTAPAASKLTCNTGEVRIQTDHDFCAHQCKDDSDCKKLSGVCDGAGKMVSLAGQMTPAHYCVMNSVPGSTGITNTPSINAPNDPATKQTAPTTPAPTTH
jgi:hypothetical protein